MGRFLMFLAYNGSKYRGIQIQRVAGQQHSHFKTVQGVIEKLLNVVNPGHTTRVFTSSRTDTGVHALCNSVHFDYLYNEEPEKPIDPDRLAHRLNHRLKKANEDIMYCQPFDTDLFLRSVEVFAGTHNFRAFTTESSLRKEAKDTVRRLHVGVKKGQSLHSRLDNPALVDCDYWDVHMESYSFLYHQVRRIVGALIEVGLGRLSTDDLCRVLEDPKYKKQLPGHLLKAALPHGLYLKKVHYDPQDLVYTPCETKCSEVSSQGEGLWTLCDEPPTEAKDELSAKEDISDCERSIKIADSRHMNSPHEHDNRIKYVPDLIHPRVKY